MVNGKDIWNALSREKPYPVLQELRRGQASSSGLLAPHKRACSVLCPPSQQCVLHKEHSQTRGASAESRAARSPDWRAVACVTKSPTFVCEIICFAAPFLKRHVNTRVCKPRKAGCDTSHTESASFLLLTGAFLLSFSALQHQDDQQTAACCLIYRTVSIYTRGIFCNAAAAATRPQSGVLWYATLSLSDTTHSLILVNIWTPACEPQANQVLTACASCQPRYSNGSQRSCTACTQFLGLPLSQLSRAQSSTRSCMLGRQTLSGTTIALSTLCPETVSCSLPHLPSRLALLHNNRCHLFLHLIRHPHQPHQLNQ